jgi:phosphomannomutase
LIHEPMADNFLIAQYQRKAHGGIVVPMLLERLGVDVIKIHCDPNGNFPHNPSTQTQNVIIDDCSSYFIDCYIIARNNN